MSNSIEIKGRTLLMIALVISSFSFLIYQLNKYDHHEKMLQLEASLKQLDEANTKELQSVLLKLNPRYLEDAEMAALRSFISRVDKIEESRSLSRHNMQIILKKKSGFYTIACQYLAVEFNDRVRKFDFHERLSPKEEAFIDLLEEPDVDPLALIKKEFSFLDYKKIIYPLTKDDSTRVYLSAFYYERH